MRKNLKLKKWFSLGIITTMLLVQGSVVMAATGWVKRSGNWYYYNEKGVKTTGWQLVKGNWYYMNSKGVMQTGWLPRLEDSLTSFTCSPRDSFTKVRKPFICCAFSTIYR